MIMQEPDDNENGGGGGDINGPVPEVKKDKYFMYFGIGVAVILLVAFLVRCSNGA